MRITAQLKGVDKLLKDFKEFGNEGVKEFGSVTKLTAKDIEGSAKIKAPIDLGKLRQSIHAVRITDLTYEVNVGVKYGAYMEFGTGALVTVPSELKEVAMHFIGKGVKQINLRPQPYLYPAFVKGRIRYIKDLKGSIKHLTKKFNTK